MNYYGPDDDYDLPYYGEDYPIDDSTDDNWAFGTLGVEDSSW